MKRFRIALAALATVTLLRFPVALAQTPTAAAATTAATSTVERLPDGVVVGVDGGWLKLQVRDQAIVRVLFAKDRQFFDRESYVVVGRPKPVANLSVDANDAAATLKTGALQVRIDRKSGAVTFLDAAGQTILAERAGSRTFTPALVQGESTQHAQQQWEPNSDESLYGLGQHQLDVVDIKNTDLELWQHNGTVIVPLLVSSRGYGILWDNASYTRFGDLREFAPIPVKNLVDAEGKSGALTASYFGDGKFGEPLFRHRAEDISIKLRTNSDPNTVIHPGLPSHGTVAVRWEGAFTTETEGTYTFQTFSNNGAKLWIDDKLVIENWWQDWLPYPKQVALTLTAGTHKLRAEWLRDHDATTMQLRWKTPAPERPTTLWSEVADGIDYTFIYGPQIDRVIAGYRELTGRASLMPVWTLGLWQSRQRYETQQQSLDVLAEYRKRGVAIDNIVQDWFYWRKAEWGSHGFDPERFPDPQGWVDAIHDKYHARVMISVWGKFYPGNPNYDALHRRGFLYTPLLWEGINDWIGFPYTDYDAFSPAARQLFWSQVSEALFTKKFDAWWMDATEPDISSPPELDKQKARMNPTAMGTGARMLNAYALMNSRGVYEGQRGEKPDQRVFILTRSGFAGIQRYGSATWSGDMPCTWEAMHRQIAAGLGFSISGVPYWSMDIGGFTAPPRFLGKKLSDESMDEWCELNTRWFQFGSFVPLVRLHGESQLREPWAFGGDNHPACRTILEFNRLRYQLLPYVYSQAGAVTHDGASFLRPLVMDFPADVTARGLTDEYLFGPSLLVAPVTTYKARERSVYLPNTTGGWYDFWSGSNQAGGRSFTAAAPYERLPLFVRAGSVIPFGPDVQYTTEKPADPITLVVYAGADGAFSLYEDDGLTYGYEKGAFARIPLTWTESTKKLTIGARTGSYPGMLAERKFNVVLVSAQKPVAFSFTPKAEQTVTYRGQAVEVTLR